MGKIVMPKNSAVTSEIYSAMEIYYQERDWVSNDKFKEKLKRVIGGDQYPSSYTKKTQIPAYFGFIEWKDIDNNRSDRRITNIGRSFFEALREENEKQQSLILLESLKRISFGRNNFGVSDSDSDIDPPSVFVRASLDLDGLSTHEYAYVLWSLENNGGTYTDTLNKIKESRESGHDIELKYEALKFKDCKPIMFMQRMGFFKIIRGRYYISEQLIQNNLDELKSLKVYNIDKYEHVSDIEKQFTNNTIKPHQRIFFGAPGTGKSYQLNNEARRDFGNNFERVTFHPNYMYGNFVGAYKPFPKTHRDKEGNALRNEHGIIQESITYTYVGGVFIQSLVKAFRNPQINFLVIIEEINRANVAAVFGDIFQLLDRDGVGKSEYKISTSKELQEYLREEDEKDPFDPLIKADLGDDYSSLFLPSNFYIWATMNSADQGVMPMDTAFRRRWEFTYLGIDEAVDDSFEDYKIKVSKNEIAKWNDFRRAVNSKLSACKIPEDKLIGPYFISKSVLELKDVDQLTAVVRDKVLMYIYEDAGKAHRNTIFAESKHDTYSIVCENFDINAKSLFKGNLDLITEEIKTVSSENNDVNAEINTEE